MTYLIPNPGILSRHDKIFGSAGENVLRALPARLYIDRKYFGLCYANIVRAKAFYSQALPDLHLNTLRHPVYVRPPPPGTLWSQLYSLALARAQKWCMAR